MNLPHTFVANTLAKAEQVNENFEAVVNEITAQGVELLANIQTVSANASSQLMTMLQTIYPVGSIYIGTMSTCPIAALFGTWEKKGTGRVLQGSDNNHTAGTTIAAGLPNIKGEFTSANRVSWGGGNFGGTATGATTNLGEQGSHLIGNGGSTCSFRKIGLNASNSSSIYSDNVSTVQPPAYVVNIWERIA